MILESLFLAETSLFTKDALMVVVSLIVIEGLLSVDNALAIAAMASHLEEKKRKIAMTVGYAGAYGFRIVALFIADYIIGNPWLMVFGSAYLIWLMCAHFAEAAAEEAREKGDASTNVSHHSFAGTIAMIAFLDLSLSFDNVVAAVAFARDSITLVYVGVTIGIITLRLVAGYCIKLLEKHPWLEHTAFLLVGFVGMLLCVELWWDASVRVPVELGGISIISDKAGHFHIEKVAKFGGILLIIFGHIAYEKVPFIRPLMRPLLRVLLLPANVVAHVVGGLFLGLTWPVRFIWRKARGEPQPS
jgi:tellurite resistance protein TerC